MNSEEGCGIILGFFIVLILTILVTVGIRDSYWQRQAVKHGAAKFIVNQENGHVVFKWNNE